MANGSYNTNISSLVELTLDDVLHELAFPVLVIGRYVHIAWYLIGFTGNIISAVIWNTSHMYNICSTAHYLVALSVSDVICQFLHLFYYLKVFWRVKSLDKQVLCEFWSLLYMIPLYISELLVLGFTIEKLISLRNPFRSGWFNRHQRAPKEIVWIVVSVTVLAFPQAYFRNVDNRGYCDHHRKTDELRYPIWHWVIDVSVYIVCPVAVVVINCIIVQEAKESGINSMSVKQDQPKDRKSVKILPPLRQSTVVLLTLSYFRVFALLPSTIVYFMEFLDDFTPSKLPVVYTFEHVKSSDAWQRYYVLATVKLIADMISSSRNAVSILIFLFSSTHFRREMVIRFRGAAYVCFLCGKTAVTRITSNLRTFREHSDL